MKLLSLDINHFKGISHYIFTLNGLSADLYGDNATGKTTIADAYFWLLFGKDSAGNSDFDVLPEDECGNIVSGLEASVAGTFSDGGKGFTLRRVYHQVFARKNGEAERKLKGNTTEFYINDVPKPQKDYQAFVNGICEEKMFRLLSDPDMFPGKMKWEERRDLLIRSFAPGLDDREIINSHASLKPLGGYIGYKSVEEYSEVVKARRRKINEELRDIPGRIDEAEKAKPSELPQPGDGQAMLQFQRQKIKLEGEIESLRNGTSDAALQKKAAEIQTKIARASAEYTRRASAGNAGIEAEAANLRDAISSLGGKISSLELQIQVGESSSARLAEEMDELRKQCVATFSLEFDTGSNICPTCGQEYPPERQKQIRADFNESKARKLAELESDGKKRKAEKEKAEQNLAAARQQLEADRKALKDAQSRLNKLMKQYVQPEPFADTSEYHALKNRLDEAEEQLRTVTEAADRREAALREKLETASARLAEIKERALNKDAADRQNKRIDELKARESELSRLLATYDKGLQLAEEFTQQKAKDIEVKVNGAFRLVRWKLFDLQVNGGVRPCCEATVNGIEYAKNLNSAAKLNAGLDIIHTLGRVLGKSVPVWIDNAESVTRCLPIDAQVIRLHVSAGDKKLRTEVIEQ